MGILACDRNGCERIMSDHHSYEFGYLCFECMSELRTKAGQITIGDFMKSPKGSGSMSAEAATIDDIEAAFDET